MNYMFTERSWWCLCWLKWHPCSWCHGTKLGPSVRLIMWVSITCMNLELIVVIKVRSVMFAHSGTGDRNASRSQWTVLYMYYWHAFAEMFYMMHDGSGLLLVKEPWPLPYRKSGCMPASRRIKEYIIYTPPFLNIWRRWLLTQYLTIHRIEKNIQI